MSDIKIARSWDSFPPTVYCDPAPGAEAISTRVLEREYREMKAALEAIAAHGNDYGAGYATTTLERLFK